MNIDCNNSNPDNPLEILKQFFNETQHQMIYQLLSVNVDILTDRDIDMTNQIVPDVDTFQYYHVTIIPANNRNIHVHISNNTFHNIYIHLDNSKISAHVTNNLFTGAGIKISPTSTDLHQPVIIENSVFQGFYSKSIFEALNTTNVYLHSCVFNNTKLSVQPAVEGKDSSGLLCFNSQIELHDIVFRAVSFFPVTSFENCTLAIYQLTMSENSLSLPRSETNSLLYLTYTEAIIEDSIFEENIYGSCFWIFGGNTTLRNVLLSSNNGMEYGRFVNATVNISNNSMDSSFYISHSRVSFSSCKFLNTYYLMDIRESYVSIVHCLFKELRGAFSIFILRSDLFIRGSHFLQVKNSFLFIYFKGYSVSLLNISHCRFESNELTTTILYSRFIDIASGTAVIRDTVFHNSHVTSLIDGKSIEFTNCVFNKNFVSHGVVSDNYGTVHFSNCSFSNNVLSDNAWYPYSIVYASRAQLTIFNCTFINNSSPHGAGAIALKQDSSLLVENSIFVNNVCRFGAGAIEASRNCTIKMFYSIFNNNLVRGYGGGAIKLFESQLESDSCQFIGNTAEISGGAVMLGVNSSYSDIRSTFENNYCEVSGGGAIHAYSGCTSELSHSIFKNNKSNSRGGAISVGGVSYVGSDNCHFRGNRAEKEGGAVAVLVYSSYGDTGSTFAYNTALGNSESSKGGAISITEHTGRARLIRTRLI